MKTKILILALLAAVLFISCEKEENTTLLSEATTELVNDTLEVFENCHLIMYKMTDNDSSLTEYNFRDFYCSDNYIYAHWDSLNYPVNFEVVNNTLVVTTNYIKNIYQIVTFTKTQVTLKLKDNMYYFNIVR